MQCRVYRCSRQQEMYLYLRADLDMDDVPGELLPRLGRLEKVLELTLTPQRKLAHVDIGAVMTALGETGFFLQMPPQVQGHLYRGD